MAWETEWQVCEKRFSPLNPKVRKSRTREGVRDFQDGPLEEGEGGPPRLLGDSA